MPAGMPPSAGGPATACAPDGLPAVWHWYANSRAQKKHSPRHDDIILHISNRHTNNT